MVVVQKMQELVEVLRASANSAELQVEVVELLDEVQVEWDARELVLEEQEWYLVAMKSNAGLSQVSLMFQV